MESNPKSIGLNKDDLILKKLESGKTARFLVLSITKKIVEMMFLGTCDDKGIFKENDIKIICKVPTEKFGDYSKMNSKYFMFYVHSKNKRLQKAIKKHLNAGISGRKNKKFKT